MNMIIESGYWTAVAEVTPMPGNVLLEDADGAYVGVIGIAGSESEFIANTKEAFSAIEFNIVALAEVELLSSLANWTGDNDMREKCAELSSRNPVELGTFHCFSKDKTGGQ